MKNFKEWSKLKTNLHKSYKIPLFSKGEVWWCSVGENIGSEINGKSEDFTRPVLVFAKFNKQSFFALPFTSKDKFGTWYVKIFFQNNRQTVVLNQGKSLSARRLYKRIGEIPDIEFEKIKTGFHRLYLSC